MTETNIKHTVLEHTAEEEIDNDIDTNNADESVDETEIALTQCQFG